MSILSDTVILFSVLDRGQHFEELHFIRISRRPLIILMEHKYKKSSLESELLFYSTCSIWIPNGFRENRNILRQVHQIVDPCGKNSSASLSLSKASCEVMAETGKVGRNLEMLVIPWSWPLSLQIDLFCFIHESTITHARILRVVFLVFFDSSVF